MPKNTEACSLSLLQRIFPTQRLNLGLLHCRWILYQLSYQGSLKVYIKTQKYTLISSNHISEKKCSYMKTLIGRQNLDWDVCDQKKSKSWVGANQTRFRVGFEAGLIVQAVLTSVNINLWCSLRQQIIKWIITLLLYEARIRSFSIIQALSLPPHMKKCNAKKSSTRWERGQFTPRQSAKRAHIPKHYSVLSSAGKKDNYRAFCSNNLVILCDYSYEICTQTKML